jgi:hypothetical protein
VANRSWAWLTLANRGQPWPTAVARRRPEPPSPPLPPPPSEGAITNAKRSRCHRQHRLCQPWLPPLPTQPAPAVVFQREPLSPKPHAAPHHTTPPPHRRRSGALVPAVAETPRRREELQGCGRPRPPRATGGGGKPRCRLPCGPHVLPATRSGSGAALEALGPSGGD